jgi:hypothetical protein
MKKYQIVLTCMALLLSALGFSLWARYGLIESVTVATQCNATSMPLQCRLRDLVIATTAGPFWSTTALASGALSVILRRVDVTLLALLSGGVGLVLYAGAAAAAGFLLGWITLARLVATTADAPER